ncbi:hypothetical protein D3C78_1006100 [compost metagenome]
MDAIRNRIDGNVLNRNVRHPPMKQFPCHLAMQLAHPVHLRRRADGKTRHVKCAVQATERQNPIPICSELPVIVPEESVHHFDGEDIVPGRNRCVRRKDSTRFDCFKCRLERYAFGRQLADALECQESRVTLIHMPDVRPNAEHFKESCTADAENHLLAYANFMIARVECVSQMPILIAICFYVSIKQVHRDCTYLNGPCFRIHLPSANRHFNDNRPFLGIPYKPNGVYASFRINIEIQMLLRAALVNVLLEITFLIKYAYARKWNIQVSGCLDMVAS